MTDRSQRWNELSALFEELADASTERRAQRLAEVSASDPALADELRALLAADASANTMLDSDAASVAAKAAAARTASSTRPGPACAMAVMTIASARSLAALRCTRASTKARAMVRAR